MNEYYNEWIKKEKDWRKNVTQNRVKMISLGIGGCWAIFFAIGLLASGGNIATTATSVVTYIIPMTIPCILFAILGYFISDKLYVKRLKKSVEKRILDESERIKFMKEILSMNENDRRKIDFKHGNLPAQVICTNKYYYEKCGNIIDLIPLDTIETIKHDELEETYYNNKVRIHNYFYIIKLYYKGSNNKKADKELRYYDAEVRNYISNLIQESIQVECTDAMEERAIYEQTEEGKKEKKKSQLLSIMFYIGFGLVVLFLFMSSKEKAGKPFPIEIDHVTVIPGKTTVGELLEQGIVLHASTQNPLEPFVLVGDEAIEGKTEVLGIYGIPKQYEAKSKKDNLISCSILNTQDKEQEIRDCVIGSVSVYLQDAEELKCPIIIDGKSYSEEIKTELKNKHKKYFHESEDEYLVSYDNYILDFVFKKDGKILYVKSSYKK